MVSLDIKLDSPNLTQSMNTSVSKLSTPLILSRKTSNRGLAIDAPLEPTNTARDKMKKYFHKRKMERLESLSPLRRRKSYFSFANKFKPTLSALTNVLNSLDANNDAAKSECPRRSFSSQQRIELEMQSNEEDEFGQCPTIGDNSPINLIPPNKPPFRKSTFDDKMKSILS